MKGFTLTRPQKAVLDAIAYAQAAKRPPQIRPRRRQVLRILVELELVKVDHDTDPKYTLTGIGAHARTYWRLR